jgi:hypothetical protein
MLDGKATDCQNGMARFTLATALHIEIQNWRHSSVRLMLRFSTFAYTFSRAS